MAPALILTKENRPWTSSNDNIAQQLLISIHPSEDNSAVATRYLIGKSNAVTEEITDGLICCTDKKKEKQNVVINTMTYVGQGIGSMVYQINYLADTLLSFLGIHSTVMELEMIDI